MEELDGRRLKLEPPLPHNPHSRSTAVPAGLVLVKSVCWSAKKSFKKATAAQRQQCPDRLENRLSQTLLHPASPPPAA